MKRAVAGIGVLAAALVYVWPAVSQPSITTPSPKEQQTRQEELSRARVFTDEQIDPRAVDFTVDPNAGVIDPEMTTCRFLPTEPTGTTPKFDCRLENGEKIKVKYGWTREIPAEIAATRLLAAMGFGADRMSRVKVVRCFGCVVAPFHVRSIAQMLHLDQAFDRHLDYNHSIDFVNVGVERRLKGEAIDAGPFRGWSFYELSEIDPRKGGATKAEVDALRLMTAFINHWDNKSSNQRLLCVNSKETGCERPLAMIQDTGSDFGPYKLDLNGWSTTPIWTDASSCLVSMKHLPFHGSTFPDVQISEGGRRLLGDRLAQLSHDQIRGLFTAAGFKDVDRWTTAFQEKVRAIVDRPSCSS